MPACDLPDLAADKVQIVTPAIDLIEIIAARGNTTLNSTVQLTVSLRNDINEFGQSMSGEFGQPDVILADMRRLLKRIEDAVPLISLALTTSGANLSTSLPDTVSPSRLLQASAFLQAGDAQHQEQGGHVKIGPSFVVKLYTIFEGHSRPEVASDITWQETYAKCLFELVRVPGSFEYEFRITEDLDDGRYHDEEEKARARRDDEGHLRGDSRSIPVQLIARLFFSATGRLLNIEESRAPVLVVKINHALHRSDLAALHDLPDDDEPIERGEETTTEEDLEWLALELWTPEDDDDDDEEDDDNELDLDNDNDHKRPDPGEARQAARQEMEETDEQDDIDGASQLLEERPTSQESDVDALALQLQLLEVAKTQTVSMDTGELREEVATLSLLEYLLRLAALQASEQRSCLAIPDERISLYLRDDNYRRQRKSAELGISSQRKRSTRFETPASSVSGEFIPGTRMRSVSFRRTPVSEQSTPSRTGEAPVVETLATPHAARKADALVGTPNSRRWQGGTGPRPQIDRFANPFLRSALKPKPRMPPVAAPSKLGQSHPPTPASTADEAVVPSSPPPPPAPVDLELQQSDQPTGPLRRSSRRTASTTMTKITSTDDPASEQPSGPT